MMTIDDKIAAMLEELHELEPEAMAELARLEAIPARRHRSANRTKW